MRMLRTITQSNLHKKGKWAKIRAITQCNIKKNYISIQDLQGFLKKIREEEK
jgi:hypothetical protein